jgi:hypothetical protein
VHGACACWRHLDQNAFTTLWLPISRLCNQCVARAQCDRSSRQVVHCVHNSQHQRTPGAVDMCTWAQIQQALAWAAGGCAASRTQHRRSAHHFKGSQLQCAQMMSQINGNSLAGINGPILYRYCIWPKALMINEMHCSRVNCSRILTVPEALRGADAAVDVE